MEAELACMSNAELAQAAQTARLEVVYERALRQAERIYEEERCRALRVQLLLLEDENDELHSQQFAQESEQQQLEDANEELRDHLADVEAQYQQAQMELKARLRDLDHARTENNALNAASTDVTKLYSEKLALSRELDKLKPELEHLKSQASMQSNALSEKLALQRELASVHVELENEKRTVHRIKAQEKSAAQDDSARQVEVEELRKELAKAHKESQKLDRESRKKNVDWEGEKEMLQGKLEAFRTKLRSTKDQLKEAHEEIEKLQAVKMAQSAELTKARLSGGAANNPKKRTVARFDPDMTIGTPGNGHGAKRQRVSVNVGDKSTFSMTPFLNRTLSILPESPAAEAEQPEQPKKRVATKAVKALVDEHEKPAQAERATIIPQGKPLKAPAAAAEKPAAKKAAASRKEKPQPLKETTSSKANSMVKRPRPAKPVDDDSDMEEDADNAQESDLESNESDDAIKAKASKRTNIFDEEDCNAPVPKVRSLVPPGISAKGGAPGLSKISLKPKGGPLGKGKVLAEFSPLKKDRRVPPV